MNWYTSRRRFLRTVAAGSTGALAGCSTGDEAGSASEEATFLGRLADRFADDFTGDVVAMESVQPDRLASYRRSVPYLQRLDRAVPLTFDVDVTALASGTVALDGTLVSLGGPDEASFEEAVDGLGDEAGTVGEYAIYERDDGALALTADRLRFVRPDDRFAIGAREVLEGYLEAEAATAEGSDDALAPVAVESFRAVDGDHLVGGAAPFGQDTFGDETEHVPGARSVAWGMTVEPDSDGERSTVTGTIAARFPPDVEKRNAFLPYVSDREPAPVDILNTSYEREMATVQGTTESLPWSGSSEYLRPRDLTDHVVVTVRPEEETWAFDYRRPDVSQTSELVLPVDRPALLAAKSTESAHSLHEVGLELTARSDWYRYLEYTPPVTGEFELECHGSHDGAAAHTAQVRFVEAEAFDAWISDR